MLREQAARDAAAGGACLSAAGASSAAAPHPPAAPAAPGPQNLDNASAGSRLQWLPESLQLPLPQLPQELQPFQPLLPQLQQLALQVLEPAVQVRLMPPPRAARGSVPLPLARWGGRCLALPAQALPASMPLWAHATACAARAQSGGGAAGCRWQALHVSSLGAALEGPPASGAPAARPARLGAPRPARSGCACQPLPCARAAQITPRGARRRRSARWSSSR